MIPADYYAYTLQLIGKTEGLKQAEEWLKTHSIAGNDEPIVPGFLNEAEEVERNGSVIGRAFTLQWGSISEEPGLKKAIDQLAAEFPELQIDLVEENVDYAEKSAHHRWMNGQCESRYAVLIMPSFGARGQKSSDSTRMAITRNVNGQFCAFELTPEELQKAWSIVNLNACRDLVLKELRTDLQNGETIAENSPLIDEWAEELWEAEKKSAEYFRSDDLGFIVDAERARQQGLILNKPAVRKDDLTPERMVDQLAAAQARVNSQKETQQETQERLDR